jgi:RNA polymerase-binding transcription factor
MDPRKFEHFKKKLLEKKDELFQTVSKTEQYGREADEDSTQDIADKAANSYTKEFLFSQSSNERFILQLVNEALDRVEKGAFGYCVSCENEIQQKRLEAVPWTRHCISCQEKQEQGLLEE